MQVGDADLAARVVRVQVRVVLAERIQNDIFVFVANELNSVCDVELGVDTHAETADFVEVDSFTAVSYKENIRILKFNLSAA